MTHDWLQNSDARQHITGLLQQMGLPLETRVSRICRQHDGLLQAVSRGSAIATTGRLVYNAGTQDGALREIDYAMTALSHSDSSEAVWINVLAEVAIECKHRDGMALFVFPEERKQRFSPLPPVASEFAYHPTFRQILAEHPYLPTSTIGTVGMITGLGRQARVADEQFIYKAGAALYDYVQASVALRYDDPPDPVITDLGLLDRFQAAEKHPQIDLWTAAVQWIRRAAREDAYQETIATLPDKEIETLFALLLPIICIDGPIYDVDVDDQGAIGAIVPIPYARTRVRLPAWPGDQELLYSSGHPEALLTVVTVDHLATLLDEIAGWVAAIAHELSKLDDATSLFEMLFMRSVRQHLARERTTGFWHE